jgi:hypothetical protein
MDDLKATSSRGPLKSQITPNGTWDRGQSLQKGGISGFALDMQLNRALLSKRCWKKEQAATLDLVVHRTADTYQGKPGSPPGRRK